MLDAKTDETLSSVQFNVEQSLREGKLSVRLREHKAGFNKPPPPDRAAAITEVLALADTRDSQDHLRAGAGLRSGVADPGRVAGPGGGADCSRIALVAALGAKIIERTADAVCAEIAAEGNSRYAPRQVCIGS